MSESEMRLVFPATLSHKYGPLDLRAFFQQGYWPWRFPLQGALYQASVAFLPSSASHSCEVPSPPFLAIMPPCQCQICLESTMEVFYGSWRLSAMWSRMSAILETCQKVTERLLKVCHPEEGSVVSKHIDPFLWLWSPFDDSATTLMF